MPILAIQGGGDWTDASVEHLAVPSTFDVLREKRRWKAYLNLRGTGGKYLTFLQWLLQFTEAREPTDDELIVEDDQSW